jgi:hypothetical protein
MPGKDHKGLGLDEAGSEEGGPVVVSMVGVKDAWTGYSQEPGKA